MSFSIEELSCFFQSIKKNDVLELIDALEKNGFKTQIVPVLSWKELSQIPLPAVLFGISNGPYFMILSEVRPWSVVFTNPKTGECEKISKLKFLFYKKIEGILLLLPED